MSSPFDQDYDALPAVLPIFPLPGALLLPEGRLPLNIFEPRYLAMVTDAMSGNRLIGMIQPVTGEAEKTPRLYRTGCVGRIVAYEETDDGRFAIALKGLCRFDVTEELPLTRMYRQVRPDWAPYRGDYSPGEGGIDRPRLTRALRTYFKLRGIGADWDAIRATSDSALVTTLAMLCPFAPQEKQALLEAPSLGERSRVMTALIEMALMAQESAPARH